MNYEAIQNGNSDRQSEQKDKAGTEEAGEKRKDNSVQNNRQKADWKLVLSIIGIYLVACLIAVSCIYGILSMVKK